MARMSCRSFSYFCMEFVVVGRKALSQEEFIARCIAVHGDKYSYKRAVYVRKTEPVCVECPIHGEWFPPAESHMKGNECPQCVHDRLRMTTEEFCRRGRELYGDVYDYSRVNYKKQTIKVDLGCPWHGWIKVYPAWHLHRGPGCKQCSADALRQSIPDLIASFREVHGDLYDYSMITEYQDNDTPLPIICKKHGVFHLIARCHKTGGGCQSCTGLVAAAESFQEKAEAVHGVGRFDYSKVDYRGAEAHVCIICNKCGAEFLQRPSRHLIGKGCKKCYESSGERAVRLCLERCGLSYDTQWTDPSCRHVNPLPFDFFVEQCVLIEFDGPHHFGIGPFARESVPVRDRIKDEWAASRGIHLVRIPYYQSRKIGEIVEGLAEQIKEGAFERFDAQGGASAC